MKKKIIISILGLCLLIGIQIFINIVSLNKEMGGTVMMMPIFAVIYILYLQIIVKKYLKW